MPRSEQPEASQQSATGEEAGKPAPTTRTVVPATAAAGPTVREAATAGAAVTSCRPSDRTKSTSEPASRLPIDHPCLGTSTPQNEITQSYDARQDPPSGSVDEPVKDLPGRPKALVRNPAI